MKTVKSWVAAVVACSAIVSQANADVLMVGSLDSNRHVNQVRHLTSVDGVADAPVEYQSSPAVRPVFVSGSLINKTSTGAWLIAQTGRPDAARQSRQVETGLLVGRSHRITPIPPAGTLTQPVSTFAHFVQGFKNHNQSNVAQSLVRTGDEIVPSTSNMTMIGLLAVVLAGVTAFISAGRIGLFGLTANVCRSDMA